METFEKRGYIKEYDDATGKLLSKVAKGAVQQEEELILEEDLFGDE